jgi:hypothetical protein
VIGGVGPGGPPADSGAADPALAAALTSWTSEPSVRTTDDVYAALARARLLVPVAAARSAGKTTEMSLVTLVGEDGRIALVAFSSLAQMQAWRVDVRPVPVTTASACASALAEGHAAVLIDVAGAAFVIEGDALVALAQRRLPVRTSAVSRSLGRVRPVVAAQLLVVEVAIWAGAWAIFRGPAAFYPAMFVGGLLGAAVVARGYSARAD